MDDMTTDERRQLLRHLRTEQFRSWMFWFLHLVMASMMAAMAYMEFSNKQIGFGVLKTISCLLFLGLSRRRHHILSQIEQDIPLVQKGESTSWRKLSNQRERRRRP